MRTFLKWAGFTVVLLLVALVLLGGVFYYIGSSNINRVYEVELAELTISTDSLTLARGAHLSEIYGCTDCHGADFSGKVMADEPPFRVTAPNLTTGEGGLGSILTDVDFDRALRHGVGRDGRPLLIMPASSYHNMSDDDAAAIISYLRTVPPVDSELPSTKIRPLGRLLAAGPIDPAFEVRTERAWSESPPPEGTVEYGRYMTSVTCVHCHGSDLRGNPEPPAPDSPPAPDLAAAGQWPLELFREVMRTGVRPDGREMDPAFMPWPIAAHMTDAEFEALHGYLATLGD